MTISRRKMISYAFPILICQDCIFEVDVDRKEDKRRLSSWNWNALSHVTSKKLKRVIHFGKMVEALFFVGGFAFLCWIWFLNLLKGWGMFVSCWFAVSWQETCTFDKSTCHVTGLYPDVTVVQITSSSLWRVNDSTLCRSKPVLLNFFCKAQKKTLCW